MSYLDYNRYSILKNSNGTVEPMPYISLPINNSDKYELWVDGISRMDKLSLKYYGSPFFDFIILYGNIMYLSEFDIPDGTLIRIPFPLTKVKADYELLLSEYMKKNT